MFKSPSDIFADRSKEVLLVDTVSYLYMFHVCLCYAILSVPCSLLITCWQRADLSPLLCVVFSCVFVSFPYGVRFGT